MKHYSEVEILEGQVSRATDYQYELAKYKVKMMTGATMLLAQSISVNQEKYIPLHLFLAFVEVMNKEENKVVTEDIPLM